MLTIKFKNTDLIVSRLCLGTGTFGGRGVYKKSGDVPQKEANEIIGIALDNGVNLFDTAEIYSDGVAEIMLGKALESRRHEAIVITKTAPYKNEAGRLTFTRSQIAESCNSSLKRLNTDYIDIYELHSFAPDTPLEETLEALNDLVKQGKVRYIGCSNFAAWQMMKGLSISDLNNLSRFVTLEAKYSMLCRELEYELVPACLDQGVNILAFSPLYGGFLSGKYSRNSPWPSGTRFSSENDTGRWTIDKEKLFDMVEVMEKIALNNDTTVSHVALNYLLCKAGVSSLIIGVRNSRQLLDNLDISDKYISEDELELIDRLTEPASLYPYMNSHVCKSESNV